MPSTIKNPFKRKTPSNKDKVVLKKADKNTTEISIARVDKKNQVSPEPPAHTRLDDSVIMDVPTLQRLLKQRDAQIASLKNEMADLQSTVNELQEQKSLCSCGAYERESTGPKFKSHFSRW